MHTNDSVCFGGSEEYFFSTLFKKILSLCFFLFPEYAGGGGGVSHLKRKTGVNSANDKLVCASYSLCCTDAKNVSDCWVVKGG